MLQIKTIRDSEYFYWKNKDVLVSIGKKNEIIELYIQLRKSSKNQKLILGVLKIFERYNAIVFFNRSFSLIKKDLVNYL